MPCAAGLPKRAREGVTADLEVGRDVNDEFSDQEGDEERFSEVLRVGGVKRVRLPEPTEELVPILTEFFYDSRKKAFPAGGEKMLMALCLVQRFADNNRALCLWVQEVLQERSRFYELATQWSSPPAWKSGDSTRNICGVCRDALKSWPRSQYGVFAEALYQLGGAEKPPSSSGVERYLRKVVTEELKGPKRCSKGNELPRYVVALVPVAELLECSKRCAAIRKALESSAKEHPQSPSSISELQEENIRLRNEIAALREKVHALQKKEQYWREQAAKAAEGPAQSRATMRCELLAKLKKKRRDKATQIRESEQACARARVQGELTRANRLRNEANGRKRIAEKALGHHKQLAESRLQKLTATKDALADATARIEEYEQHFAAAADAKKRYERVAKQVEAMPTWQPVKGGSRGRPKMEWGTRVIIYSLLAMMCPASAVGGIIVAIVKRTAPWLNPAAPTHATVRELRFELRIVEEALAGRRVASAYRVRQLGFDETTKFQDPSMVSSVLIEPSEGAPPEVVILRAAYSTGGGTSELLVKAMEEKCFARLRGFIQGWENTCKELFPDYKWTGPNAERCGLQRLGGGGSCISDTCTPARCTQRLLIAEVARQVEEKHPNWEQLNQDQKEEAVRMHTQHCFNHIRNIFLKPMSAKQSMHVREVLKEQLEAFSSWERMETDFDSLLRAVYKEFHHGGRYYKGKGKEFLEWLRDHHPSAFVMHIERAEGGRQDLEYDAAVPMYIMRPYIIGFLHERVFAAGHSNILEDFLYRAFLTTEYVAMMRANAAIDLLIARPLRWLAGKSSELAEWSPYSMGPVLDTVEQLLERGARDGSIMLNASLYDPSNQSSLFASIVNTQPKFRDYLDHMYKEDTVLSPDGKTKHTQYKLALEELLNPNDPTNQRSTELTIEYLQVQCGAGLTKLHDTRTVLPQYLTSQDGALCWDKVAQGHADTRGCEATNDKFSESVFGVFDMMLKRCDGISREAASALAQAVRAKSFWQGDAVKRRKKQEQPPPGLGYFHTLPVQEQEALVEYARRMVRVQRGVDRADNAEVAAYVKAKVRSNSEEELQALITEWGYGLSFFERWQQRGVRTVSEVFTALRVLEKDDKRKQRQDQLDWLREQVEMRTRGLRWVEFQTHWSSGSDEHIGTVEELTEHLKLIVQEERSRRVAGTLPESAPAPIMKRKTFKDLGTPTAQADALSEARTELSLEELMAAAQRERERLEAIGEIDTVGDAQPAKAPGFDALVGRELDLRWRYYVKDTTARSGRRSEYIWCTGTVVEVADGKTTRRSARCKSVLPWGAVRIRWPEDEERDEPETFVWSVLEPHNWNKEAHLGWRYSKGELLKLRDACCERSPR